MRKIGDVDQILGAIHRKTSQRYSDLNISIDEIVDDINAEFDNLKAEVEQCFTDWEDGKAIKFSKVQDKLARIKNMESKLQAKEARLDEIIAIKKIFEGE